MIELKHIDKYYNIGTVNEVCLFKDFNLTVDDGDFISVIGSNGSGKTSMLNLICGSLEAEAGNIILNGEDISHQKRVSITIFGKNHFFSGWMRWKSIVFSTRLLRFFCSLSQPSYMVNTFISCLMSMNFLNCCSHLQILRYCI